LHQIESGVYINDIMSRVKLQLALDFLELDRAILVAKSSVPEGVDYIEAGTPLIKSEGLDAVRELKKLFPEKKIIADMKTMDAGKIEAEAAAKSGAGAITVCGTASLSTITECVETGIQYGVDIIIDLIGVEEIEGFIRNIKDIGVSWLSLHCPIDAQMLGLDPLKNLKRIRGLTDLPIAVAGGLNSETAAYAAEAGADIIIVGGAITKAKDPKNATIEIRRAIDTCKPVESALFKRKTLEGIREILMQVSTCNISDGAHRLPCLYGLKPLLKDARACGPAVTVRTVPGDWAKPVEAIDVAKKGEVIVIDSGGKPPAVWGELATESAKNKGITAIIVYGAVRDTPDIKKLGIPVWYKQISSNAGDPNGLGEINCPIIISGQKIFPGDWIAADDDGVMVLPALKVVEMANRASDVLETENRIREEIRKGNTSLAKVINLIRWEKKGGSVNAG
jgi:3-hexulose-6-phosphate synthase/6-phospho-3-hexuloisomerase